MKPRGNPLLFVVLALLAGIALVFCERWYELTFGIKYRTVAWWVATMLDGAPFIISIAVSGNVHQGSEIAFWIGFAVQWALVGLVIYGVRALIRRRKKRAHAL